MSKWELPKEHYNWESPITKIYGDMQDEIVRQDEENCIFAIKQSIGYKVDKEELIKALQYDREQYDKGYRDGVKEKFVEELEKIKAEIEEKESKLNFKEVADVALKMAYIEVAKIMDNHISELKGETE